jgi:hypothetical protein
MNHLVCGYIAKDQRNHFGIVEPVGNRNEILGVARKVLGPGTVDRQRADALPEDKADDAFALVSWQLIRSRFDFGQGRRTLSLPFQQVPSNKLE